MKQYQTNLLLDNDLVMIQLVTFVTDLSLN